MKKVTFSGGADGKTVTFSGGNDAMQTITQPTPLTVQMYAYPNVTVGSDPAIEQRISDLEQATDGLVNGSDFLSYYILSKTD